MQKIGCITQEEIYFHGWRKYKGGGKTFYGNSAFLPIARSGTLVGLDWNTKVYLPHKKNLDTDNVDIFDGEFMMGGLDKNLIPENIKNNP